MTTYRFNDVTLLITHYNRSNSLERLLKSFRDQQCFFNNIIISDDASQPYHLNKLKILQQEYGCQLITAEKNKGLGNNINKGQDAVRTPLTLYVQEDFEPAEDFAVHFKNAVEIMRERNELDIIRFYAYFKYPYLKSYKNGFSEMVFRPWYWGYRKFYYYSDHPHLRRSSFLEKFGRYQEGLKGDVTEYRMMMSFLRKKGKGLFYENFENLFYQKNSVQEPSTMKRNFWRETNNPIITKMRHLYRHVKFNYDLYFSSKF